MSVLTGAMLILVLLLVTYSVGISADVLPQALSTMSLLSLYYPQASLDPLAGASGAKAGASSGASSGVTSVTQTPNPAGTGEAGRIGEELTLGGERGGVGEGGPDGSRGEEIGLDQETSSIPLIPGSRLFSPARLRSFRLRLHCLTSRAQWQVKQEPRELPWGQPRTKWAGWECDERWGRGRRSGRLAFDQADAMAALYSSVIRNASLLGNSGPPAEILKKQLAWCEENWKVRPSVKYRWQVSPACGPWGEVDRGRLAHVLAGRKLLVVGDSINGQVYASLRNHLMMKTSPAADAADAGAAAGGGAIDRIPKFCMDRRASSGMLKRRSDLKVCIETVWGEGSSASALTAGGNTSTSVAVVFVRDDVISTSLKPVVDIPARISIPWFDQVTTTQQGGRAEERRSGDGESESGNGRLQSPWAALVLNRGAHFHNDSVFSQELQTTLTAVRAADPNLLIIYRSTPGGHPNCTDHDDPYSERPEPNSWPFHWGEFARQNEIAREMVEKVGGVFLDVATMTALRPDGHYNPPKDCLHYCLPGPPDEWVRLLYHVLLDLL